MLYRGIILNSLLYLSVKNHKITIGIRWDQLIFILLHAAILENMCQANINCGICK